MRLLLAVCALALIAPTAASVPAATAAPTGAAPTAAPGDPQPPLPQQAEDALAKVQEIFSSTPAAGTPQHPEADLTLALKDLALLAGELRPAQQKQAAELLARPTQKNCNDVRCYEGQEATPQCTTYVCVHYIKKSRDKVNGVPGEDDGSATKWKGIANNNVPDYVDVVLQTMTNVDNFYADAGYRRPLPDGAKGGDNRRDIYLEQIGDVGYYGYCTIDPPYPPNSFHGGLPGYCVLDNDYSKKEFSANSPIGNMRVTAAHEYFHAVQFGYDVNDDNWFFEATATWAEDVLFDQVNDNVYYLPSGPMAKPGTSLDSFKGLYHYGAWIFFRYLTDRYGTSTNGMPDLVREMWELADANTDANPAAPDMYSMEAVKTVLGTVSTDIDSEFSEFAAGNRRPGATYTDEAVDDYPTAPLASTSTLTQSSPKKRLESELDHLTSRTYRFKPGAGLTDPAWHLRLNFDLNDVAKGGYAIVSYKPTSGSVAMETVTLDSTGVGTWLHSFVAGDIAWVEVTIVNASTRYNCGEGTIFSCRGKPRDDNAEQVLRAKIVQP